MACPSSRLPQREVCVLLCLGKPNQKILLGWEGRVSKDPLPVLTPEGVQYKFPSIDASRFSGKCHMGKGLGRAKGLEPDGPGLPPSLCLLTAM